MRQSLVFALTFAITLVLAPAPISLAKSEYIWASSGELRDGKKFVTQGDKLYIVEAGKQVLAKNGPHVTKDGLQFVVQNGRIVKLAPLTKRPPPAWAARVKPGGIGQTDDIPEKTESYWAEVDPSVEYGDDKSGIQKGVKGKVLTPGKQAPAQTK